MNTWLSAMLGQVTPQLQQTGWQSQLAGLHKTRSQLLDVIQEFESKVSVVDEAGVRHQVYSNHAHTHEDQLVARTQNILCTLSTALADSNRRLLQMQNAAVELKLEVHAPEVDEDELRAQITFEVMEIFAARLATAASETEAYKVTFMSAQNSIRMLRTELEQVKATNTLLAAELQQASHQANRQPVALNIQVLACGCDQLTKAPGFQGLPTWTSETGTLQSWGSENGSTDPVQPNLPDGNNSSPPTTVEPLAKGNDRLDKLDSDVKCDKDQQKDAVQIKAKYAETDHNANKIAADSCQLLAATERVSPAQVPHATLSAIAEGLAIPTSPSATPTSTAPPPSVPPTPTISPSPTAPPSSSAPTSSCAPPPLSQPAHQTQQGHLSITPVVPPIETVDKADMGTLTAVAIADLQATMVVIVQQTTAMRMIAVVEAAAAVAAKREAQGSDNFKQVAPKKQTPVPRELTQALAKAHDMLNQMDALQAVQPGVYESASSGPACSHNEDGCDKTQMLPQKKDMMDVTRWNAYQDYKRRLRVVVQLCKMRLELLEDIALGYNDKLKEEHKTAALQNDEPELSAAIGRALEPLQRACGKLEAVRQEHAQANSCVSNNPTLLLQPSVPSTQSMFSIPKSRCLSLRR